MAVAISAISAAAAAFGTEAFIGLAATAVADTGLALSVVGAVTGSKDLVRAGAALGLAGGIGGLANSMFGAAADGAASAATSGAADVTAGTLADEGGVNGMDLASDQATAASNATGTAAPSTLSSAGMPSDVTSTTPSGGTMQTITSQTGNAVGGTPTLSGAGGNVDPTSGMALPSAPPAVNPTPGITPDSVQGNSVNALDGGANYGGIISGTRASSIIDGIKDLWGSLGNDQRTTILRAALAIPGGIQAQQNKARELALQAAKIQQTSYGSAVPSYSLATPGIINSARSN